MPAPYASSSLAATIADHAAPAFNARHVVPYSLPELDDHLQYQAWECALKRELRSARLLEVALPLARDGDAFKLYKAAPAVPPPHH